MQRSSVIIGAYNLLPEGTEEQSFEETYQVCWRPLLSVLYRFPDLAAVLHYSGTVLHWLESRHPEFIMLLEEMVLRKQVELLGGGFYAPILPLIPGPDRLGQIELLTTYIRRSFGKRPRGCWLPDYAWEPSLPSTLQSCGFDYTFLTERHFRMAGAEAEGLGSAVMTEDQGRSLLVFPAYDAMESFPHPMPIVEALSSLASRLGERPLYSLLFPGESARALWSASKLESPDVFFERSFAGLQREALRFETTTPSRFLKGARDFTRAYFPSCASALLMERSMPLESSDSGPRSRKSSAQERFRPVRGISLRRHREPAPPPVTARGEPRALCQDALRQNPGEPAQGRQIAKEDRSGRALEGAMRRRLLAHARRRHSQAVSQGGGLCRLDRGGEDHQAARFLFPGDHLGGHRLQRCEGDHVPRRRPERLRSASRGLPIRAGFLQDEDELRERHGPSRAGASQALLSRSFFRERLLRGG